MTCDVGLMNYLNFGAVRDLAGRLVELCYPGSCVVCRERYEGAGPMCGACSQKVLAAAKEAACVRCAKPLAQEGAPCPWCQGKGLYPYERIARLGVFEDPLRLLVHQMKYHRRWSLGETLADWLARQRSVVAVLNESQRVVAVPLHFRRLFSRGYNQAELIARRLSGQFDVKLVRAVKRVRDTQTQAHLRSQKARQENMRGAFALVDGESVRGMHVVVVDDVMTSGATLQAVGRELMRAEPASLSAVVVAAADPKRRDFQAV